MPKVVKMPWREGVAREVANRHLEAAQQQAASVGFRKGYAEGFRRGLGFGLAALAAALLVVVAVWVA